jgi:hypothetical protein
LNLMDQSCLDYLRMALPNIKELSIKATRTWLNGARFDISEWGLTHLDLGVYDGSNNIPFYCAITFQNITKLYMYDLSEPILVAVNYWPDRGASVVVHIITVPDKHLMFNGYSIVLSRDQLAVL